MLRTAATATLCALSLCAQRGEVPSEAELEKARPDVVRLLGERLTQAVGGDVDQASCHVLAAAFDAQDRATRYLLWRQAVGMAERSGNAWLGMQHERALAADFALDTTEAGVALLKRMADGADEPERVAAVAMAALYTAGDHNLTSDETAMHAYFDVAVRAALRADHAPLYAHVRDQLARLRAPRAITPTLEGHLDGSPWRPDLVVAGLLLGEVRMLQPFTLGQLAPLFEDLGGRSTARQADGLDADDLTALADRARHPQMRDGLLRCALQRLIRGYRGADAEGRRRAAQGIEALCGRLCREDGVSRLRFARPDARAHLAYANGDWRVADRRLVGATTGADNFATHRVRFSTMNAVVLRGGIRSEDGLNFRCKVGDVNLLFNWEMEDQNHLWHNGACHRTSPRVLRHGEEHSILVFTDGASCHVCVDGHHLYTVPGYLSGTVSVYPALGSEIFVRELLVDGAPDGLVDGPVGVMM